MPIRRLPSRKFSKRLGRDLAAELGAVEADFLHGGAVGGLRLFRDIDRIGTSG